MMVHIQYNLNTTISLFSSRHRAAAAPVYGVCSACDLIKFGEIPWFFASPRPGQGRHVRAAQHRRAGDTACGGRVSAAWVRVAAEQSAGGTRTRRGCGGWGVGHVSVSSVCRLPAPPVLASTLHALLANGNIHLFVSANHGPVTHFLANESAACCPARRCRGDPLCPGVNPLLELHNLDMDTVMSTRYVETAPYVLASRLCIHRM